MSICAVLGDPVAHSLSPVLHRAGYAAVGLPDWTYHAVRVPAGTLAGFLADVATDPDLGWRGLSLTMPLKREVLALAARTGRDEGLGQGPEPERYVVSEAAAACGGANTVVVGPDRLEVDNTDRPGAAAALRERYAGPLGTAVVLGAGATAASAGLALVDLGVAHVHLLARDAGRAEATRALLAAHPAAPEVTVEDFGGPAPITADVVVSTVPAAAQSAGLVDRCRDVPLVFEVLYDPWPTPLAAAATDDGRTLVGGLDLLVHQAALQFTLFTGHPAPLDAMRTAGEEALRARG